MLLQRRVRNCTDDAEYVMLRQQWDSVNRPQHQRRTWSPRQEEVLGAVAYAVSLDDEEQKRQHQRCLFVSGGPGSDKSAVLLELAVRSAKAGLRVLIVCPTGQLVHSFNCQLPEMDGIENVQVDTIHAILGYKRPGPDGKVVWAPPSALRRIDLILVDEASQYDNKEWKRFAQSVDGSFTIDWQREDDQPRLLRALRDEYAVFCHFRACDLYNVWDYVWPSGERYPVQYFGICPRSI